MRNVIKSICFIFIFIILLGASLLFLLPKYNLYKYHLSDFLDYEILEEKDDTIDVLFVGDSLVYSSVSPMEIWNEFKFTSFDCSTPAQLISTSYDYMKIAVERQHPKVIFLEANVLFRNPKKRTRQRKYDDFIEKYSVFDKYHDNWKDLLEFGEIININKGYKYINRVKKANKENYMRNRKEKVSIPNVNLETFNKIVELCNSNNIRLILFGVPSMKSWSYAKDEKINELVKNYDLTFIDLNVDNVLNIDWTLETKDEGSHLNYEGAKKVSSFLGNYIKENNLAESHMNDEIYNKWNIYYKKYLRQIKFY